DVLDPCPKTLSSAATENSVNSNSPILRIQTEECRPLRSRLRSSHARRPSASIHRRFARTRRFPALLTPQRRSRTVRGAEPSPVCPLSPIHWATYVVVVVSLQLVLKRPPGPTVASW